MNDKLGTDCGNCGPSPTQCNCGCTCGVEKPSKTTTRSNPLGLYKKGYGKKNGLEQIVQR